MEYTTVRMRKQTRDVLRAMADQTGESMGAVLEKAIEAYRRQRFLENVNAAYDALRSDPAEWAAIQEERAVWDVTLGDGLPRDEDWGADDDRGAGS